MEATATEEDTDSAYSPVLHYKDWLPEWNQLIARAPTRPCIPSTACIISTPLNLHHWSCSLESYPNRALADFFLQGISEGFRIGFSYGSNHLKPSKSNLAGARSHPNVVEDYLQSEVSLRRVAGPFLSSLLPNCQISRFGVIPKNRQPGKWRLIVDLSHPKGKSVNDGIAKDLCSLKYITLEDAVQQILTLGPGTSLAKIDIKSAFRLLPVHSADRHLLGMKWNGEIYLDSCLPFGLRSAPRLFNILADLLEWILQQEGVSVCLHYLDDFLTVDPPKSPVCQQNLDTIRQICEWLGIPLALDKVAILGLSWHYHGWKHVSLWTNYRGLGNRLVARCKRRKPPNVKSFHSWESYSIPQRLFGVAGPSLAECMLQPLSCEKCTFTPD